MHGYRYVTVVGLLAILMLPAAGTALVDGGGSVNNVAATVPTLAADTATVNKDSAGILSGTVSDQNGEVDLVSIKVATVSGPVLSSTHTVTAAERAATSEPASFGGDGWKVWNPTASDGLLSWKYQQTYTTVGTYTWAASVKDEGNFATGPAANVVVEVVEVITVFPDPVDAAGAVLSGIRWGGWAGNPGGTDAAAANYLRVKNTGTTPSQSFLVDFSAAIFSGVTDSSQTININNNIQYDWWEDVGGDNNPQDAAAGNFDYLDGSGNERPVATNGQVTLAFTGTGNDMYIVYRIVDLPSPLLDQAYGASFTVTPV